MDQIDDLLAATLRSIAHPRRLRIIHLLAQEPREVARLAADLGISQPNASQHLGVLRAAGLVEAERVGREVRYRLVDPDVTVACTQMRRVLARRLDRLAELASGAARPPRPTHRLPGHAVR
jgi:DNA-binding transcriptional ArsR family regulator